MESREKKTIEKRTWEEFKDSGLLWWVNRVLHTFGWTICFYTEGDKVKEVYPARCKHRGFSEKDEEEGFKKMQINFTQTKWHDVI